MNFLDKLRSRRISKPISKQLDILTVQVEEIKSLPSYADCQDLCTNTRSIWDQLHTRFVSKGRLGSADDTATFSDQALMDYTNALEVFEGVLQALQRAQSFGELPASQNDHVAKMIANTIKRIEKLKIVLNTDLAYNERWKNLLAVTERNIEDITRANECVPVSENSNDRGRG